MECNSPTTFQTEQNFNANVKVQSNLNQLLCKFSLNKCEESSSSSIFDLNFSCERWQRPKNHLYKNEPNYVSKEKYLCTIALCTILCTIASPRSEHGTCSELAGGLEPLERPQRSLEAVSPPLPPLQSQTASPALRSRRGQSRQSSLFSGVCHCT